jgi:hypothetical protein
MQVAILQVITFSLVAENSWTVTNVIHLAVSLWYFHWLKGSPFDEQGEMGSLTVWEQMDATIDSRPVRRILLVVPTLLTYLACHLCDYDPFTSLLNAAVWMIAMLPKMSYMSGVRLFGINRTVGIDDEDKAL